MISKGDHPSDVLPFAGNFQYVNIFSAKGNIVSLNDLNENDYQKYHLALLLHYSESEELINNAYSTKTRPGKKLWFLTKAIADKNPVKWNSIFRKIGIDGCFDNGASIIHKHEPTQAVFFSINAITNIERFDNKKYDNELESDKNKLKIVNKFRNVDRLLKNGDITQAERDQTFIDFFHNLTPKNDEDIFAIMIRSFNLSDEILMSIFDIMQSSFRFMKNPSERLCLYIVKQRPDYIQYMENPSEKIKRAANYFHIQ